MQDAEIIWQAADKHLTETMEISRVSYKTWFGKIQPIALKNGTLYLCVPTPMHLQQLNNPQKAYRQYIESAVAVAAGRDINVELLLPNECERLLTAAPAAAHPALNPAFTFDTFVVGEGNQFAQAAALSVAEAPATQNNPLFIYGGVGLGKTHLMHAIGNYILAEDPHMRVVYTTCEKYTNEFIEATKRGGFRQFHEQYRNSVDVLMIDDIQFLGKTERTQEEMFHNINDLVSNNKQIVITSDRPPRELATLADRLRSRFEGGLIVDIVPPDLETRIAILTMKAEACGAVLDNEMLHYIAERASGNVRELEGSLKRVVAYAGTVGGEINMDVLHEALKDYKSPEKRTLTVDVIIDAVAEYFDVARDDVLGRKRDAALVTARHIGMYLCREHTDLSFPRLADEFGRDHSSVIHGYGKVRQEIMDNEQMRSYVTDIEHRLLGG